MRPGVLAAVVVCVGLWGWGAVGQEAAEAGLAPGRVEVRGVQVRHAEELEGMRPAMQAVLDELLERTQATARHRRWLREHAGRAVAEVNAIVGGAGDAAEQEGVLLGFLGAFPALPPEIVVLTREGVKDHLRGGGSLPLFAYDAATDAAVFRMDQDDLRGATALPIVVKADGSDFEAMASQMLAPWVSGTGVGDPVHEMIEFTLLRRMATIDPHRRWFYDGLADALTVRLLAAWLGDDGGSVYVAEARDLGRYEALRGRLNLRLWMGAEYEPQLPIAAERRLSLARYAYAMHEFDRLLEAHGTGVVADIFDAAAFPDRPALTHSERVLDAIEEVAGEDLRARLAAYDDGLTVENYRARLTEAMRTGNVAAALPMQLRSLERETFDPAGPGLEPSAYYRTALFAARAYGVDVGERVIRDHLDLWRLRQRDEAVAATREMLLAFALTVGRPAGVRDEADEQLEADADDPLALTVVMLNYESAGEDDQAKSIARRLVELNGAHERFWRRHADRLLASD